MTINSNWHQSQRGYFFGSLLEEMGYDKNIWVITADLGYKMLDKIRDTYPDRFLNCGASEQSMLDIAVGLTMSGKRVFAYSITPFLLFRAAETIRIYINGEKIPVFLVGGGRDKDYEHDGPSHISEDDCDFISLFDNIKAYWPGSKLEAASLVKKVLKSNKPSYINLQR